MLPQNNGNSHFYQLTHLKQDQKSKFVYLFSTNSTQKCSKRINFDKSSSTTSLVLNMLKYAET